MSNTKALDYWGDGSPSPTLVVQNTLGLLYWGDGLPSPTVQNPVTVLATYTGDIPITQAPAAIFSYEPVVIGTYAGDIPITQAPAAKYSQSGYYTYDGSIPILQVPGSTNDPEAGPNYGYLSFAALAANNFDGYLPCVAHWHFDSSIGFDAQGKNPLWFAPTGGGWSENTTDEVEGDGCFRKECYNTGGTEFSGPLLAGSKKSNDFPLKYGTTNQVGTICGWFNFDPSGINYFTIFRNGNLRICLFEGTIDVFWNAQVFTFADIALVPKSGQYYHFALAFDGNNLKLKLRVFGVTENLAVTKTFTPAAALDLSGPGNIPLYIGSTLNPSTSLFYDSFAGLFDDWSVFTTYLSDDNIDVIRQQDWPHGVVYNGSIGISQTPDAVYEHVAKTIGTYTGNISITQTPAAEYSYARLWFPYYGNVPISQIPEANYLRTIWVYDGAIPIEQVPAAGYFYTIVAWLYTGNISFIQIPAALTDRDRYYSGDIAISLRPYAVTSTTNYFYAGNIPITLIPAAICPDPFSQYYTGTINITLAPVGAFYQPNYIPVSGTAGLIFGSQTNLFSGAVQGVSIPGASGLMLGIKPNLAVVSVPTVVISGQAGLDFGSNADLFAPSLVVIAPSTSLQYDIFCDSTLLFGASCGLVSNLLVPVEIPGWSGLLFAAAPLDEPILAEDYETWVLNDNGFAPAAYSGWPFNSYAQYHGQYYAAGDAGLFLLGGPDQDGVEIHSGIRLSKVNFSSNRQKRLRTMKLGATGDNVMVRLATDRGDEGFFSLNGDQIPVSRDIQGRDWVVDIQDFDELSFIEIIALILCGR